MRNATAQRLNIMVRVSATRQALTPHVRHAETGGCVVRALAPQLHLWWWPGFERT